MVVWWVVSRCFLVGWVGGLVFVVFVLGVDLRFLGCCGVELVSYRLWWVGLMVG